MLDNAGKTMRSQQLYQESIELQSALYLFRCMRHRDDLINGTNGTNGTHEYEGGPKKRLVFQPSKANNKTNLVFHGHTIVPVLCYN